MNAPTLVEYFAPRIRSQARTLVGFGAFVALPAVVGFDASVERRFFEDPTTLGRPAPRGKVPELDARGLFSG